MYLSGKILNVGEMGLYWKRMPDQSYISKQESYISKQESWNQAINHQKID